MCSEITTDHPIKHPWNSLRPQQMSGWWEAENLRVSGVMIFLCGRGTGAVTMAGTAARPVPAAPPLNPSAAAAAAAAPAGRRNLSACESWHGERRRLSA